MILFKSQRTNENKPLHQAQLGNVFIVRTTSDGLYYPRENYSDKKIDIDKRSVFYVFLWD